MFIGGFQKLSLIDFPGVVSSVVFSAGCNFRCPYCHNPGLVFPDRARAIPEEEVFSSIESARKMVDGVVVTGGEPTVHSDLPDFLKKIKNLGLLVKLDTNGANPGVLRNILSRGFVDYVAMDIKAPLEKYPEVAGVPVKRENIVESMAVLRSSGVIYEFRTTIFPGYLSAADYEGIAGLLRSGEDYYLQDIRYAKTLGGLFDPGARDTAEKIAEKLKLSFPEFSSHIFSR